MSLSLLSIKNEKLLPDRLRRGLHVSSLRSVSTRFRVYVPMCYRPE